MTVSFFQNLKGEFLKCRNSAAFWITLGGAAFIPLVNLFKCVGRPDYFVEKVAGDPWGVWLEYNWQIAAAFFLTMYIICVTSLVVQIEHKSSAWKQVYTSPRSFADIFFSKILTILLIITSCFVLFNIFMVIAGYATGMLEDHYPFATHALPLRTMLHISVKMFISILAMTTLQYWLSLRFKNFIIPMGIGLALFTTGFMIRQWQHIDYYPYMHPFLIYFKNPGLPSGTMSSAQKLSVLWSIAVLSLGFIDSRLRKEKG